MMGFPMNLERPSENCLSSGSGCAQALLTFWLLPLTCRFLRAALGFCVDLLCLAAVDTPSALSGTVVGLAFGRSTSGRISPSQMRSILPMLFTRSAIQKVRMALPCGLASRSPHFARDGVARVLGLPQNKVPGIWAPGAGLLRAQRRGRRRDRRGRARQARRSEPQYAGGRRA
jgi:hypothetical protein